MSYFGPGDLVTLVNTGEVHRFAAHDLRLAPGVLIPYTSGQSYAQDVLDAVGREVDADLGWHWPAPYDGDVRRAMVRHRDAVLRAASYALFFGVDHPNAHFKIAPETISAVSP